MKYNKSFNTASTSTFNTAPSPCSNYITILQGGPGDVGPDGARGDPGHPGAVGVPGGPGGDGDDGLPVSCSHQLDCCFSLLI